MKIKFVYGIFPAFINYKEVDGEVKNYARNCRIVIEPKYKCDRGILEHELTHVRQWYKGGLFVYNFRYKHSRKYRLESEVEAYLNQTKFPKCNGTFLNIEGVAERLTWDRYGLNLTKEQALAYLLEEEFD